MMLVVLGLSFVTQPGTWLTEGHPLGQETFQSSRPTQSGREHIDNQGRKGTCCVHSLGVYSGSHTTTTRFHN